MPGKNCFDIVFPEQIQVYLAYLQRNIEVVVCFLRVVEKQRMVHKYYDM